MIADHTATDIEAENTDISDAAEKLRNSFEEMSSLTDELSGTMTEVADGFASFSEQTESVRESQSARIEPTAGRETKRTIADD